MCGVMLTWVPLLRHPLVGGGRCRVAAQVRMGMEGFNISDQGRRFTQSVAFGRRFEFAELLLVGFKPLAALPNSLLQVLTELTVPLSEDDPCQVTLGRVGQ
mmetsp:Transcript_61443/g.126879  ORF Transcript_61443/g.126879 Transcript_61443/m.126879 type:complete len:101 (+) Transcript_61443:1337-1639(+)